MSEMYVTEAINNKWHAGLPAAVLTDLAAKADEISRIHADLVHHVVRQQIKVGQILLQARDLFAGDKEFGQWREAATPVKSRQTAHRLMQLASQVGQGRITDKVIDALPTTTIFEMLSAPDSVVQAIEQSIDQAPGAKPPVSQKQVRQMAAEVKANPKAKPSEVYTNAKTAPAEPEEDAFIVKWRDRVQAPLHTRIAMFLESGDKMTDEWAFTIMGLCPFADFHPNLMTICYLIAGITAEYETKTPSDDPVLTEATNHIRNLLKESN